MRLWFWLAFASVVLSAAPLHAAEPLAPGSWSVQFSVQPNLTLGSFQGSTLSLKRHFAGGRALRLGLSVRLSNNENNSDQSAADTTFLSSTTSEFDLNDWSIGMSGYYLWYSRVAAPFHVYWGAGPFLSVSGGGIDEKSATTNSASSVQLTSHRDSNGWGAGLAAALGVEWQVASRVGVFAEYGSSLGYFSSKQSEDVVQSLPGFAPVTLTRNSDSHGVGFSDSGGRLGVSAYF